MRCDAVRPSTSERVVVAIIFGTVDPATAAAAEAAPEDARLPAAKDGNVKHRAVCLAEAEVVEVVVATRVPDDIANEVAAADENEDENEDENNDE